MATGGRRKRMMNGRNAEGHIIRAIRAISGRKKIIGKMITEIAALHS